MTRTSTSTSTTRPNDFVVDLWLYPKERTGRSTPRGPRLRCPCVTDPVTPPPGEPFTACDAEFRIGERMIPGARRRVDVVALTPEGAETLKAAGTFYLWEMGIIGEATFMPSATPGERT